jgi:hypothetical protein
MGRKNSMDTRLDSFNRHWDKKKYQRKLRADYIDDTKDWTDYLLKKLQKRSSDDREK